MKPLTEKLTPLHLIKPSRAVVSNSRFYLSQPFNTHVFLTLPLVWQTFLQKNVGVDAPVLQLTFCVEKKDFQEREIRLPLPIFWSNSTPLSSKAIYAHLTQPNYPNFTSPLFPDLRFTPLRDNLNELKAHAYVHATIPPFCEWKATSEQTINATTTTPPLLLNNWELIESGDTSKLFTTIIGEPRWVLNLTRARDSYANLQRPNKFRDTTLDFPQLSTMYRKAKTHFNRFLGKLRRNLTLPSLSPFEQMLPPLKPSSRTKQYMDHWTHHQWVMRKIRFKPGISRIWRIARRDIKIILKFPVRYQHRLTWRLTKLARTRNAFVYYSLPHQLQYLLMRFRFSADVLSSLKLLQRGAIFLNGQVCSAPQTLLVAEDRINMVVSWEYYIMFSKLAVDTSITSPLWFKLLKFRSFRSCYRVGKVWYPASSTNKFNHIVSIWDDTPPFFQIDFFSLSCFILRETIYTPSSALGSHFHTPIFILNMYNWKYIT